MIYRAIGIMSGSSLDGLDLVFAEFTEQAGKWIYSIHHAECREYDDAWRKQLARATTLDAKSYQLLHTAFGRYIGETVNGFIARHALDFQVALIASHGHTVFHDPANRMTAQIGDGAAIAATTALPVVTDLRSVDVALGGQGAPIVPIGEKLLLSEFGYFLNIGGIANLSVNTDSYTAFDVCPANRVLNELARERDLEFDRGGAIAATGKTDAALLKSLNTFDYYHQSFPKSLANEFGTDTLLPVINRHSTSLEDRMHTYCDHIALQVKNAVMLAAAEGRKPGTPTMLVTGGGTFNDHLVSQIKKELSALNIEVVVPEPALINFKEALIMAFIGVLRWRQEYNVLSSVTGASRNSINGALWLGGDE